MEDPPPEQKRSELVCVGGGRKEKSERKKKLRLPRSLELMVHLSVCELLTGSSLSPGKTKVKR